VKGEDLLKPVAPYLAQLPWKLVYVGGSVTHLLLTDHTALAPEGTDDVDVVLEIVSPVTFRVELAEKLRALGAREDTREGAPLCRWILNGLQVDVLGPTADLLGFTNSWYPMALQTATAHRLSDGTEILVIAAVPFVATKLEAFAGRGKGDCMSSKDIDDVIAVLDGRPEFSAELAMASADVRAFIREGLRALLSDPYFRYAVDGYLSSQRGRAALVLSRIEDITNS